MAAKEQAPAWQICMTCNRRQFSAEPVQCQCGARMIPAIDHPDNAWQRNPQAVPAKPKPAPVA